MEAYKKPLILSKNEIKAGNISGAFPAAIIAAATTVASVVGFAKALGEDDFTHSDFARTLTERKNFALA